MYTFQSRRKFIFSSSILLGGGMISHPLSGLGNPKNQIGRIGIIGLDTSHSVAFTKALNGASENTGGFKIVAAYPNGSADIESSVKRIPGYTEEVKKYGVEIVGSVGALLSKVDFVCLETNDGRPHLQQALEVFKAGKPIFIDKPVAGSLSDTIAIYELAKQFNVHCFFKLITAIHGNSTTSCQMVKLEMYLELIVSVPLHLNQHTQNFSGMAYMVSNCSTRSWEQVCKHVKRTSNKDVEMVVGEWNVWKSGNLSWNKNWQT